MSAASLLSVLPSQLTSPASPVGVGVGGLGVFVGGLGVLVGGLGVLVGQVVHLTPVLDHVEQLPLVVVEVAPTAR